MESPTTHTGFSMPSSPTNTYAARALTAFAQQPRFSAESICPIHVIHKLVDDYFIFIHPVIPLPHEASFRRDLETRQDTLQPRFLALLASMIACMTATFPRQPRQHLKANGLENPFPNSMSFIDRCQAVATEALGLATHNRQYTVDDAIICYLQGLTNIYIFQSEPAIMYFKDCLSIVTSINEQQKKGSNGMQGTVSASNGEPPSGPQHQPQDPIAQEFLRRMFWNLFVTVKTLQQLGLTPSRLNIPPSTRADPWPPLPNEDDRLFTSVEISQPFEGIQSKMTGFNINTKIFRSYDLISRRELCYGVDELVSFDQQRREIMESLEEVKDIVKNLPPFFKLEKDERHRTNPEHARSANEPYVAMPENRVTLMLDIQRANIHATQLGTRSYLVEKYFALKESYKWQQSHLSPTVVNTATDSDESHDALMTDEYRDIIPSLLHMLSTIQQIHMEPNGASLIGKVRSIASTLLSLPPARSGCIPNAEHYLKAFVSVLSRLESTMGAMVTDNKDDEDLKLRQWADLQEAQSRFLKDGGFTGGAGGR